MLGRLHPTDRVIAAEIRKILEDIDGSRSYEPTSGDDYNVDNMPAVA